MSHEIRWNDKRFSDNKEYNFEMQQDMMSGDYELRISDGQYVSNHILKDDFVYTKDLRSEDFYQLLVDRHERLVKSAADYKHPGPSNQELENNPALRHAWDQYQIIKRLQGR